jgi:hypothetical protein
VGAGGGVFGVEGRRWQTDRLNEHTDAGAVAVIGIISIDYQIVYDAAKWTICFLDTLTVPNSNYRFGTQRHNNQIDLDLVATRYFIKKTNTNKMELCRID